MFACAADGWAFRTDHFAEMYASKLGCSSKALRRGLWGDWFYHPKSKKIVGRKTAAGKLKPLFVQCVLDPIWKLYHAAEAEKHGYPPEGKDLATMAASLKVDVLEKDLKSADRKSALDAIMKAWLPLSPAVLEMVAHCLPSPTGSSTRRVHRLMPAPTLKQVLAADDAAALAASRKAVSKCSTSEGSVMTAFISKMLAGTSVGGAWKVDGGRILRVSRFRPRLLRHAQGRGHRARHRRYIRPKRTRRWLLRGGCR